MTPHEDRGPLADGHCVVGWDGCEAPLPDGPDPSAPTTRLLCCRCEYNVCLSCSVARDRGRLCVLCEEESPA